MRLASFLLTLLMGLTISANDVAYTTPPTYTVDGITVSIQFYGNGIVRVMKYPKGVMPQKKSYSVIARQDTVRWKGNLTADANIITTDKLKISISKEGLVSFYSLDGRLLLREKSTPTFSMCTGDADEGSYRISQTWALEDEEAIFGLGQLRDDHMNQRHRKAEMWNHNTYISIPYFTSEKGYGVYWDNAGRSMYEDNIEGLTFSSEVAKCIDYYFMYDDGTQDGVIRSIRHITGQATMFPLWAMGHWQCRERYKTSDELAAVLDRYRELNIPLDAIVQDWQYWGCDSNWNAMKFQNPYYINKVGDSQWEKYLPDDLKRLAKEQAEANIQPRLKSPEEMVSYVHSNNAHLMISIWANFGSWTEPYRRLKEINALLPFDTWPRNKGVLPYDPFNPEARNIYWEYLSHLYNMGFDAWWTDSTEPDHFEKPGDDDYRTYDGTWRSVKNAFSLMTNRGIYEHQRAMPGNNKRSLQMTRSGAFGLQHYGTFSWSGDINASWSEMRNQIPSGLNYTLCGIPFWNTDIGGFFYWDYNNDPKNPALQELQTRWMQWGTFMPLMRNHCSSPMVSELYEFGEEGTWAYDAMKRAINLRYRLLPYIYSLAGNSAIHDGTIMRPFVMDFPSDKKAINLNDEYMFGQAMLIKPVTTPLYTKLGDKKKGYELFPDIKSASEPIDVYLPQGVRWYDFWTGEIIEGGQTVSRQCPIDIMPIYVRAGSILPMGPFVKYSTEKSWNELEIRIYPGADGSFTLYEDEGDGYNYENGAYSEITFYWDDAANTLTIDDSKGYFPGMLTSRKFNIVVGATGDNIPSKFNKTIKYKGKKTVVKIRM